SDACSRLRPMTTKTKSRVVARRGSSVPSPARSAKCRRRRRSAPGARKRPCSQEKFSRTTRPARPGCVLRRSVRAPGAAAARGSRRVAMRAAGVSRNRRASNRNRGNDELHHQFEVSRMRAGISDKPAPRLRDVLRSARSHLRLCQDSRGNLALKHLYVKDDTVNHPTLSYKDRVVSVAITKAREFGFTTVSCASTGNLATAVAAHAARAGLKCFIFMPEGVEAGKIVGSTIYGAQVITIRGNYDDVNRLCSEIADKYGWAFVNINLRPYYTEGAKTFGFEIAEQLGWKLPDHIVVPTAGGTILPKVAKAFKELKE